MSVLSSIGLSGLVAAWESSGRISQGSRADLLSRRIQDIHEKLYINGEKLSFNADAALAYLDRGASFAQLAAIIAAKNQSAAHGTGSRHTQAGKVTIDQSPVQN
jgi:hypothetical protein